jgi:hypothetical protein
MAWVTDIPMKDGGWRQITLSAKALDGANVRFSPVVTTNNIAGRILHESVSGKTEGIVNPTYAYEDGTYTWWPAVVPNGGEPFVWIATNVFIYELGDFVNVTIPVPDPPTHEPQYFDLSLPGQPTIRIAPENLSTVVEVLHAVANYLDGLRGTK